MTVPNPTNSIVMLVSLFTAIGASLAFAYMLAWWLLWLVVWGWAMAIGWAANECRKDAEKETKP